MKSLMSVIHCIVYLLPGKIKRKLRSHLSTNQAGIIKKIEFSNGESIHTEQSRNQIHLTGLKAIVLEILGTCLRLQNIIQFILILLIQDGTGQAELSQLIIVYYAIGSMALSNLVDLALIKWIHIDLLSTQKLINERKCCIFSHFELLNQPVAQQKDQTKYPYSIIAWEQLLCGQIVCLQRGQESPADLLILDSSSDQITINYQNRYPCSATLVPPFADQKGMIIDFKVSLNGTIQYQIHNNSITGTLKLKKDPKATKFDNQNIIYRGESFVGSDWVYGFVLQVGQSCIRVQSRGRYLKLKQTLIDTNILPQIVIFSILLLLFFAIKVIYEANIQTSNTSLKNYLSSCVLLFPFQFILANGLFKLIQHYYHQKQFVTNSKLYRDKKQQINQTQPLQIIEDQGNNVLLHISKSQILNVQGRSNIDSQPNCEFKGVKQFTTDLLSNIIKTDLVVIDNPDLLFRSKMKVSLLIIESIGYTFDFTKISDHMKHFGDAIIPNSEKLLIDTKKYQKYDEQMKSDMDINYSLKSTPKLMISPSENRLRFQSSNSIEIQDDLKKQQVLAESPKLSQFASVRRANTKIVLHSSNSSNLGLPNNNLLENPPKLIKQKSGRLNRPNYLRQTMRLNIQTNTEQSEVIKQIQLTESDFIMKLATQQNLVMNEFLLTLLICNDVNTIYDTTSKQFIYDYGNQFDPFVLEFAAEFQYILIHSSVAQNCQPDYILDTITQKSIQLGNTVKLFEILHIFKPTQERPDILSVLVRDPESFLMEEGTILYTRYEYNLSTSHLIPDEIIEQINVKQSSNYENLQDLQCKGLKSFIYTKYQISFKESQELLQVVKRNRVNPFESPCQQQLEYESKALLTAVLCLSNINTMKLHQSSNQSLQDDDKFDKCRLIQTLQSFNIKSCLVTNKNLDKLIQIMTSQQIISNFDELTIFSESDTSVLRFKMKNQIQYILEGQSAQYTDKMINNQYLLLNDIALDAIIEDDYLRYHLLFLYQFSNGIAGYNFSSKHKGKLNKLLNISAKFITSIGSSMDNYYLNKNSEFSLSCNHKSSQATLPQPMALIHSVSSYLQLLLVHCPRQYMFWINIMQGQIYHNMLIALVYFGIQVNDSDFQPTYILVFYLCLSNFTTLVLSFIIMIRQCKDLTNEVQNPMLTLMKFHRLKRMSLPLLSTKTILISLLDSILIVTCIYINQQLFDNSQIMTILVFINLEITEKFQIILELQCSCSNTVTKKIILIAHLITSCTLIILLQIAIPELESTFIYEQYSYQGFLGFVLNIILIWSIKYVAFTLFYGQLCIGIYSPKQTALKYIELGSDLIYRSQIIKEQKPLIVKVQDVVNELNTQFQDNNIIDAQIIRSISNADDHLDDKMNDLLKFADSKTESEYFQFIRQYNNHTHILVFLTYDVMVAAIRLYQILDSYSEPSLSILIFQIVSQLLIVALFYCSKSSKKRVLLIISIAFRFICKLLSDIMYYPYYQDNVNMIVSVLFILAYGLPQLPQVGFILCLAQVTLLFVSELILQILFLNSEGLLLIFEIMKMLIIFISLIVVTMLIRYRLEYLYRYSFILQDKLEKAQRTMNDVLGLLMPKFIKERITKGQISISEDQGEVTLLFCEVCDFDNCIQSEQENIVPFLDKLFRQFDKLCKLNDVQKIETVGKTYMAAAGLKDYQSEIQQSGINSTQRILNTAIGMMEAAQMLKYGDDTELVIKVGVHYGRVIAGVIGAHKPQFSLIGDTVNTTSRVCSTGQPKQIILSQQAYSRVSQNQYQFQASKVEAKGKGMLQTYILVETKQKTDYSKILQSPQRMQKFKQQLQKPIQQQQQYLQQAVKNDVQITPKKAQTSQRQSILGFNNISFNNIALGESAKKGGQDSLDKVQYCVVPLKEETQQRCSQQPRAKLASQRQSMLHKRSSMSIVESRTPMVGANKRTSKLQNIKEMKDSQPDQGNQKQNQKGELENQTGRKSKRSSTNIINHNYEMISCQKYQDILQKQASLNVDQISRLMKQKVDAYQNIEDNQEQLASWQLLSQVKCYQVYDKYKNTYNKQPLNLIISCTIIQLVIDLLYILAIDVMSQFTLELLIWSCVLHFCSISITLGVWRRFDEKQPTYICQILYAYLIIHLSLNISQTYYLNYVSYELVLKLCQASALFLSILMFGNLEQNNSLIIMTIFTIYLAIQIGLSKMHVIIILYSVGFIVLSYIIYYFHLKILIKNYHNTQKLEQQAQAQQNILSHMLPSHILSRFITDQTSTENYSDFFEDATILFADIAGFTKYSGSVEPEQVVTMLRSLFINFDQKCQELNAYKLYTIGDCYVAIGIIDANNRDPTEEAVNIVLLGLKMIEIIDQIKKNPEFQHLNMRIGIHTGDIIGGIVGTDVVRYDIYGENVTIANKMESNGCVGKVMVSEATKDLLEEDYDDMFCFDEANEVYIQSSKKKVQGYYTVLNESIYE